MRRIGTDARAPLSLGAIAAFVFPAMIAAALALAYYGFQYADSASRPIEALAREYSRAAAERTTAKLEIRVDQPALALFEKIAAEKKEPTLLSPCDLPTGPAIESYVVLGAERTVECAFPPDGPDAQATRMDWSPILARLAWDAVRLGSPYHYHELAEGGSLLVVYTVRKTADDQRYFVAARMNMDLVGRKWLEDTLGGLRESFRVAVLDEDGAVVSGAALASPGTERDDRFLFEDAFGSALYRWRIQIVPQNAEAFQAQLERQKRLRPLLIVLSTIIIAVGLGIVWLVVHAERRASRLKGDFIANVSHELKTPLSLIRMFGEMVASGRHKGEDAAREYGAIITRESERLSHLIDNVLDFARLERGKASYEFAEGRLAEVLERALDICRYRLDKEKLKLRTQVEPDLPLLRLDEHAMTLVILNLVDNAIKHAAEGGVVEVALQRAPGAVVLSVRDRGPGIDREEQGRIFERFYRARAARDRNVRGSGIGLALVKYIAQAHGGRVAVESPAPGADAGRPGSMFRVYLPASAPEGAAAGVPMTPATTQEPVKP